MQNQNSDVDASNANEKPKNHPHGNAIKDPSQRINGEQPITGEIFPSNGTKAEASQHDSPVADQFMSALQEFERSGDSVPLVALFSENATLSNFVHTSTASVEKKAAKEFWDQYRRAFKKIESRFTSVHASDEFVSLEWLATGLLPEGTPIEYCGVSLLELENGRIGKFRTYYDSACFITGKAAVMDLKLHS